MFFVDFERFLSYDIYEIFCPVIMEAESAGRCVVERERMSSLQIQAYDYLKDMILSGKLDPDELYSETRLSAQMGISRTPMREGIQCLSQDGYITVVPSKGFKVRSLSGADMEEIIQIRCAIEGFCVHLAAVEIQSRKGQMLLAELDRLLKEQEKVLDGGQAKAGSRESMERFMEYDHQFHQALIDFVGNREFVQTFQRSMHLIRLTTQGALAVPGRAKDTLKEHGLIYSYLKDGQGDAAYKLMLVHLMTPLTMHIAE